MKLGISLPQGCDREYIGLSPEHSRRLGAQHLAHATLEPRPIHQGRGEDHERVVVGGGVPAVGGRSPAPWG